MSSQGQEAVRWFAIAAMVTDHIGAVLFPDVLWLRLVGRLAFPAFAFLLAYNITARGVSPARYVPSLALWGVVAAWPHTLALGSSSVNILFTLALGCAFLVVREWTGARRVAAVTCVLAGASLVEFGVLGVALVPATVAWLRRGPAWVALPALVAVAANWPFVGAPLAAVGFLVPWVVTRARLGLPRLRRVGWVVYPAHLALLAAFAFL